MTPDEQIKEEQGNSDRLEREIADLKASAQSILNSAESKPPRERGNAVKMAEREIRSLLGKPLEVRLRQKKESDECLRALKDAKQSASAGANCYSETNATQVQQASRDKFAISSDASITTRGGQESGKSVEPSQDAPTNPKEKWSSNPEIAKRRTIVKQNPTLTAQGMCRLFDEYHVPLPKSLMEAGNWSRAYKGPSYRHRVDSLVSRDKRAVSI